MLLVYLFYQTLDKVGTFHFQESDPHWDIVDGRAHGRRIVRIVQDANGILLSGYDKLATAFQLIVDLEDVAKVSTG